VIFLLLLAKGFWLKYKRQQFIQKIEWVLLEIKPPREIKKTPQAMEQFFAGLHGTQTKSNWKERNIKGFTQRWFSLEIISQGGDIHFFIRTASIFRDIIEANIYSQYPEAEITETNDYVQSMPSDILSSKDYDIWGTELILAKEDAYPIRTYKEFEKGILFEEQRIDPIATLLEVMAKLKQGEQVWIQTLVRPVKDYWKKEAEQLKDKLAGRKPEKKHSFIVKEIIAWKDATKENLNRLLTGEAVEEGKEEEDKPASLAVLTKAEQEVIYAIEQNISKIGYETIIRFIYLGHTDIFSLANVAAVVGSYKQFSTQNLNGLKPNKKITTKLDYKIELKKVREPYRKNRLLFAYKNRNFVQYSKAIPYLKPFFFENLPVLNRFFMRSKPFVFNIEELATIFHFPIITVKAPLVPKVEAKKAEPPSGLPVE